MTWNSSSLPYVPPRFTILGYDYDCSLSTLSPSPSTVRNLNVISYAIGLVQITLKLSWSPPLFSNGELGAYDICVGIGPLEPEDELPMSTGNNNIMYHYCGTINENENGKEKQLLFYLQQDVELLYVQVS